MKKENKSITVFGTFDIFHKGHINFLKQARRQGDFLMVVVARDKTVSKIKKRETRNKEQKRKRILEKSSLADKVILGNLGDKYAVIKKYQPDIICLGYDQKISVAELRNKLKQLGLEKTLIRRLKSFHPEKYKSSLLS